MRRHLEWLIPVVIFFATVMWSGGCVFGYMGCGEVDLEMELQVLDASTGLPIPGAEIEITSREGFPRIDHMKDSEPSEPMVVTFQTDDDGIVRIAAGKRFCTTFSSAWGIYDTIDVYLPWWQYEVSAAGYGQSARIAGSRPKYLPQERVGRGPVKQVIRWRLVPEPPD